MEELMIKIDNVTKQYRLGAIGGGTLQADLQSWWARKRGKEDPNSKIGSRTYGKNEKFMALNGVSFEVKKGERVGIIGHNGAGKSTLLKLLSRVTAPTSGDIYLGGRISSMLEVGTGFHQELTGRENIYMNGAILGMTKKEIDSKIDQIIEFSECGQFIDTPVKRYSSGMYVKLAFSVAAHLDSEILVMDEVLAVGDMAFQKKCLDKMNEVSKQDGRTILYVSHNMNTIRQLCNRCVVLDHGTVAFNGDVEEGISHYLNKSQTNDEVDIDLESLKHADSECSFDIKMNHLELINKVVPIYSNNEMLNMLFKVNIAKKLTDVSFRFSIRTDDDVIVGTSWSEKIDFSAPGEKMIKVSFDTSNLSQGRYFASIGFYKVYDSGRFDMLDHITKAISFEIEQKADAGKMIWSPYYWGHTIFPNMKISESSNE